MATRPPGTRGSGEFALIKRYFENIGSQAKGSNSKGPHSKCSAGHSDISLGVGDDCALINPPAAKQLCLSIDTLVEGIHFPPKFAPEHIAQRALGTALSDLAAMGACASHFSLALTLPSVNEQWLSDFSRGLAAMSERCGVSLVGGDTTKGPLTISIQVHGWVAEGAALCRSGAKVGDLVFVSGELGSAAGGLALSLAGQCPVDAEALLARFEQPWPRLALGEQLVGLASSCIDVSDGLLADAGHIAMRSGVALALDLDVLPIHPALVQLFKESVFDKALSGGDDYELLFTLPPERLACLEALDLSTRVTQIGTVKAGSGVSVTKNGQPWQADYQGYQHFE